MALTEEPARVNAADEAVKNVFPTAGYVYVLAAAAGSPRSTHTPGS